MNVSREYPLMIFRKDNKHGTFYSVGISRKDKEGKYINGYKRVGFRKDVDLENKTKIVIKNAWLDFYIKDKKTVDYIFISDFELV